MSKARIEIFKRKRYGAIQPASSAQDFEITASYLIDAVGRLMGSLKVVRKTDGRLIYPFAGSPTIGPFESRSEARDAARELGLLVVASDLANPE